MKNFNQIDVYDVFKGILFSVLFSIFFVMVFATLLKLFEWNDACIIPTNIAIKIVSLVLGCTIGFKNGKNGLFKGFFVGIFYVASTYLIFSLINHSFKITNLTIYDGIACCVAGILSGVISVNLKKTKIS